MNDKHAGCMPGKQAKMLLEEIAGWEWVTTIVLHAGSVFEFKGPFPTGTEGQSFFNLNGELPRTPWSSESGFGLAYSFSG